jgi:hypothetical protein
VLAAGAPQYLVFGEDGVLKTIYRESGELSH